MSDETGGNVVVVDPGSRHRGREGSRSGNGLAGSGSRATAAAAGRVVGFADCGPGRRRVQAPAAGSCRRRHRRGRSRHAQAGPHPRQRSGSRGVRHVARRHQGSVSNEDAAGDVGPRPHVEVRASASKWARSPRRDVTPDGRFAYVGCEATNEIVAVDTERHKVAGRVKTGPRPRGIAFTPDGKTAFVGNENGASCQRHRCRDAQGRRDHRDPPTAGAPTAPRPMGAAIPPDGRQLFFSLGRETSVAIFDAGTEVRQEDRGRRHVPGASLSARTGGSSTRPTGPRATFPSSTSNPARSRSASRPAAARGAWSSRRRRAEGSLHGAAADASADRAIPRRAGHLRRRPRLVRPGGRRRHRDRPLRQRQRAADRRPAPTDGSRCRSPAGEVVLVVRAPSFRSPSARWRRARRPRSTSCFARIPVGNHQR